MHRRWPFAFLYASCAVFPLAWRSAADEPDVKDPYVGKVHKASDEGLKAIKRFQLPKGTQVSLFAAEPDVANIVAFCFDEKGRCYVAETFRLHAGVTDNRSHMYWLDDDLSSRTVGDRLALYKKHLKDKFAAYGVHHDRIRLLEDITGDGKADKATIFADGFKNPEDGIGAGVLARRGTVWYTNIPHLWMLKDTQGKGRVDVIKSLHTGYGVHVAFIGHDSHGLRIGPDGKLYFSIGDRGLHVEIKDRVISNPDHGAVLRCDLDGSNLEIVHVGLRNPQELAFNQYGDLFTGDNNADGGDAARWVHIVEGGDSGWRIGYQYMKNLGPWNGEKIWHTQHEGQPAASLPPLAHIANGPSGLTYHPGVSLLPEKYKDHFFLVDFRGGSGGSGIHAFTLKPKGATFEPVGRHQFVWSVLATDCDFAPDGGFYFSDWVEGWGLTNKGRIYKLFDPERLKDPLVKEVKELLAQDWWKQDSKAVAKLLDHPDQRVRQEAQFTLVDLGRVELLKTAALKGKGLARLHGIWGLGQLGRSYAENLRLLPPLLKDDDAEVRAQAVKVLGNGKAYFAREQIVPLLKDSQPRVRFFAALALSKVGIDDVGPVVEFLKANNDADSYLRHAGVMALTSIVNRQPLRVAANDPSAAVRLGVLLAMRRLRMPEVADFLKDVEPRLVLEAARAIYDEPIPSVMPKLAELLTKPSPTLSVMPPAMVEPLMIRAIAAAERAQFKSSPIALAQFAAKPTASEKLRLAALDALGNWGKQTGRDRIIGLWRPLPYQPKQDGPAAFQAALAGILQGPDKVRAEGARLAAQFGIKEVGPLLRELVADKSKPPLVRLETLRALETLKDNNLTEAAQIIVEDKDARLRHEGRRILLKAADPKDAIKQLANVLMKGELVERQGALDLLAGMSSPLADNVLVGWLERLLEGQASPEIHLDILDAARRRATPEMKERLAKVEAGRDKKDELAEYRETLTGGDAERGRQIFFDKAELSCLRCHKVQGLGGEVGPDLTGISKKFQRDYLLRSIVLPNKEIAKGYETVVLALTNGQFKTGIVKSETAKEVRLLTAEGQTVIVPVADIEERSRGKSAMPDDLIRKMSKRELRDLVEFLAGL